jgi:hypothetical protein
VIAHNKNIYAKKSRLKFTVLLTMFWLICNYGFSQTSGLSNARPRVEQLIFYPEQFAPNKKFHSGIFPANKKQVYNFAQRDTIRGEPEVNKLNPKFFNNRLTVGPKALLRFGREGQAQSDFTQSNSTLAAGAFIDYQPNGKWNIYADVFGFREYLPTYVNDFVEQNRVLPGIGTAFRSGDSWNAANATFLASFSPTDNFDFTAGKGKIHLGNGYRSLHISNNAPNLYFLKGSATFWRFKYSSFFTLKDAAAQAPGSPQNYQETFAAYHHLSFNITDRLNLSIFETVIWQNKDSLHNRGFEYHYLNPVIFYRPVEFAIGSADKVQIGAEISYKAWQNTVFYSQIVIDEFNLERIRNTDNWWGNKFGGQIGVKAINPFKIQGLFVLAEINAVRPYTYSHYSVFQAFGHLNQPLAHPLGSNFIEGLVMLGYNKNNWFFNGRLSYYEQGLNTQNQNFGSDIFISNRTRVAETGIELLQGLKNQVLFSTFEAGRYINKEYDTSVFVNAWLRAQRLESSVGSAQFNNTLFYYIGAGIRVNMNDFYRDF